MEQRLEPQAPVLIVGAGPVGQLAGLLLARQGIRSLIIDRREQRLMAPRAHALNPRTLEICAAAGIDLSKIRQRATPAEQSQAVRFMTRLNGEEIGVLPYERQDEAVLALTPTPILNIAQPDFEAILIEAVQANPAIELRYGQEWMDASETPHGVTSTIRQGDGQEYQVRSEYVVACDGANSAVREAIGVPMEGAGKIGQNVSIQFAANLEHLVGDKPAILYWTLDPDALGTLICYRLGENMVFVHNYDSDVEAPDSFTTARCQELVRAAIGDPQIDVRVKGVSHWILNSQVATAYRRGRIFLAGDAAHRFPPAGGLGLNTGVGDVHNLVWKIAAVRRGWAGESLLDSYQAERRPVAQANADQSMTNVRRMGQLIRTFRKSWKARRETHGTEVPPVLAEEFAELIEAQREHFDSLGLQLGYSYQPDHATPTPGVSTYSPSMDPGGRLPHAWVQRDGETVSTLDLLSDTAFTLVTGANDQLWRAAAASLPWPIEVRSEGAEFIDSGKAWAKLAGLAGGGAVLVRPDGHILATFKEDRDAANALQAALRQFSGPAREVAA